MEAAFCGPDASVFRNLGVQTSTTIAAANSHSTKFAGIASGYADSRASTSERPEANGHGTRPIHAAAAHIASAER